MAKCYWFSQLFFSKWDYVQYCPTLSPIRIQTLTTWCSVVQYCPTLSLIRIQTLTTWCSVVQYCPTLSLIRIQTLTTWCSVVQYCPTLSIITRCLNWPLGRSPPVLPSSLICRSFHCSPRTASRCYWFVSCWSITVYDCLVRRWSVVSWCPTCGLMFTLTAWYETVTLPNTLQPSSATYTCILWAAHTLMVGCNSVAISGSESK